MKMFFFNKSRWSIVNGLIGGLTFALSACVYNDSQTEQIGPEANPSEQSSKEIKEPIFDTFLKSSAVEGAILVYSQRNNAFWSNDFQWSKKGRLPASTYKIPHSIIALETEVVHSDQTLFLWDGESRALDIWEQDLTFKEAFQKSCVPCYQEVARKVGATRMQTMLEKLDYGNMVFDTTNIDEFWLTGSSVISPFEQLDFLNRLMREELPISEKSRATVLNMMELEAMEGAVLRGKTGWAIREDQNNGWFVGMLESEEDTLYVAVNIEPLPELDMATFPRTRYDLAKTALKFITEKRIIHE